MTAFIKTSPFAKIAYEKDGSYYYLLYFIVNRLAIVMVAIIYTVTSTLC